MAKGLSLYTFRKSNLQSPPGENAWAQVYFHPHAGRSKPQQAAGAVDERAHRLPVEIGETESTTIGSLAVQLAASEADGQPIKPEAVRQWARDPLPAAPTQLTDPARSRLAATYA